MTLNFRRFELKQLNDIQVYILLAAIYALIRLPFFSTFELVTYDGTYYLGQAKTMFGGQMTGAFPIGYPLVVKLFQLVVRNYQVAGTAVSFVAGLGSVIILYRLARRLIRFEFAFLVAAAWALNPLFIRLSLMTMSESLYIFWVLLGLLMYAQSRWLPFGLVMGFAVVTRPEALAIVALLCASRIRVPRQVVRIAAGFLVVYAINVAVLSYNQGRLVVVSKTDLFGSGAASWKLRETSVNFEGRDEIAKTIAEENKPVSLTTHYIKRMPCEFRMVFLYTWPVILALALLAMRRRKYLFLLTALVAFFVNPLFTPRCADRFILPFLPVLYLLAVLAAGTLRNSLYRRIATGLIVVTVVALPVVNRAALRVPEAPDMLYAKSLGEAFRNRVAPGDKIAGRKPFFAFYAGGEYKEVPLAPYDDTMEALLRDNVRYLELHQPTIHPTRPPLRPLMYSSNVIRGEMRYRPVHFDPAGTMVFKRAPGGEPLLRTRLTTSERTDIMPVWSPDGQAIAFRSKSPDGDTGIYIVEPGARAPRRLTDVSWIMDGMSWSPDGSRVAFADRRAETVDIFVADAVTGAVEPVVTGPGSDVSPSWSADGRDIVFCSDRSGSSEIWIAAVSGRELHQLTTDGNNTCPAFSPDGNRIAWIRSNTGVVVMHAADRRVVQLRTPRRVMMRPAWSPDGRYIAVTADDWGSRDIYLLRADGTSALLLTKNHKKDVMPAWSPDGRRMALASDDGSEQLQIWIVDGLEAYLERLNAAETIGVFTPPPTR